MKRLISLGAGVNSTTLLLMSLHGKFNDRADAAIFSDTGWEPRGVMEHLAWLEQFCASVGFPILRTSGGDLRSDVLANAEGRELSAGSRFASLPFFVHGANGRSSMLRRQCTKEYKVTPVRRIVRQLSGGKPCELWLGICVDEPFRIAASGVKYIANRYPLVDAGITRSGCVEWLQSHGYPVPPKSSCVGCPFHDHHVWRDMKLHDPESWASAIDFDLRIRRLPRIDSEVFLHPSLKPLPEVELGESQIDLWGNECTGHCGV